jgi:hypothetical protein
VSSLVQDKLLALGDSIILIAQLEEGCLSQPWNPGQPLPLEEGENSSVPFVSHSFPSFPSSKIPIINKIHQISRCPKMI